MEGEREQLVKLLLHLCNLFILPHYPLGGEQPEIATYARDMAQVQLCVVLILRGNDKEASFYLSALEKYVALRREQEWKSVSPFPTICQFFFQ